MTDEPQLGRLAYAVLAAAAVGIAAAKVLGAEVVYEPSLYHTDPSRTWPAALPQAATPTHGSNDRARWATVRALVDDGTFVIGRRVYDENDRKKYTDVGIRTEYGWGGIDVVMNPDTGEFYSSKPPLLPVIAAGEYWLMKQLFGWEIAKNRWEVMTGILLTINVLPFAIYLYLVGRALDRLGGTEWGRLYVFTAACFATYLVPFAVTFNNHTPAAFCALFALYPWLRPGGPTNGGLVVSGFFAALTAAFDLPGACLAAFLGLAVLVRFPHRVLWYALPALIPVAASVGLNYLSIGKWSPAYAEFGGPWYNFEGSFWRRVHEGEKNLGIETTGETKAVYAFHCFFGHHGLFSLTPVWLLSVAGAVGVLVTNRDDIAKRCVAGLTLAVLAVMSVFVVFKTSNYGGWTSGPRWLFWFTPLLLLAAAPAADLLSRSRRGRAFALVCLAVSAFSVAYNVWNPWRHPWIYFLCWYMDWVRY